MNRRKFIKKFSTGVGAAATLTLGGIPVSISYANSNIRKLAANSINDRSLVIINMRGGNDGLNTIVPINQYDTYANRRPTIYLPDSGTRKYINLDQTLGDEQLLGLHPDMTGFKELYDRGNIGIVQNVGYPNINGSHFKGQDIIGMGGKDLNSGWVGRYFDQVYPSYPENYPNETMNDPLALELSSDTTLIFARQNGVPVSVSAKSIDNNYETISGGLAGFTDEARGYPPEALLDTPYHDEMSFLLDIERSTEVYATILKETYDKGKNTVEYPETGLAGQLKTVAQLLSGGSQTKVFMTSIGGFDKHAGQVEAGDSTIGAHATLLKTISDGVLAFQDDLKAQGLDHKVLVLTTTEFGRPIDSNESYGTDHGEATPWFLIGSGVMPGVIGTNPDLTAGTKDIPWVYDYRQILTSIMTDWFGASNTEVENTLFGDYLNSQLPVLRTSPLSVDDFINERFRLNDCYPNPATNATTISFYINSREYVELKLIDSSGREVQTIVSEIKNIGLHENKVDLTGLAPGNYFFKIKAGLLDNSKKLIIK